MIAAVAAAGWIAALAAFVVAWVASLRRAKSVAAPALSLAAIRNVMQGETASMVAQRVVAAIAKACPGSTVRVHARDVDDPTAVRVLARASVGEGGVVHSGAVDEPSDDEVRGALLGGNAETSMRGGLVRILRPTNVFGEAHGLVEIFAAAPLSDRQLAFVDDLLIAAAPAICHAWTRAYARRLSTEVRTATAAVAVANNELENVFDAIADGLAVSSPTGEIVRLNSAGRAILDACGSPANLADPNNPLLQALREGEQASGLEVAVSTCNGQRIVQVKLTPLSKDEGSRAAVAVFRDVTRERMLEQELRAQGGQLARHVHELERRGEQLEHATRLKSEFLAKMSHELRTPLNAVIGFAEVLLDGTYGALNGKQTECARDVLAGGRHLLGLINDILDLSKIEAGKMELEREDVDIADVVDQAVTLVRPQAVAKEIVLVVEVKQEAYWVNADADRLRQVFLNLFSNAVKFTPNGGRVCVVAEAAADGRVRVAVTDTGIGIAADQTHKLFEEFSQVDGSIRRRFGGTGLGLAISKRLVEMHGGTIGFESQPGVGSTFWFALPAAAKPHRTFGITRRIRRSSCSRLQPVRITPSKPVLLLDADAAAARLILGTLEEAGIPAVRATTLAEARALQSRQSFSAMIVDPPAEPIGAEALHFAAMSFGSALLVVSTRNEHDVVRAIGHASFAEKPIDRVTFVEKVRTAIARGQGPRTALVVDSNRADADAVGMLLVREGFTVQTATTMAAARIMLASTDPRLVVLDLDLADGDGTELLREVAEIPAIASVVLTARKMNPAELARVDVLARVVAAKGTLSRSSFARQISMALQEQGPTRRRVLAVDDNEQNLRLVAAVLTARGYELLEARDASSAIAIARAERPDAILMDVMLPDIDGLTATRTLKRDGLTSSIPVIALTANAMPGDAEKAMAAGCCDYVPKPIDVGRLVAAIENAIALAPPRLSMMPPARAMGG